MPLAEHLRSAEDEISQITVSIWASVFGVDLQRTGTPPHTLRWTEPTATGCVQITGQWEGAVTVHCSQSMARKLAALMFSADEGVVTPDEVRDALGEIANMTGGNFKNLLPGPCQLSLPSVTEGSDHFVTVPGSNLLGQVGFTCEGQILLVSVLEKNAAGQ